MRSQPPRLPAPCCRLCPPPAPLPLWGLPQPQPGPAARRALTGLGLLLPLSSPVRVDRVWLSGASLEGLRRQQAGSATAPGPALPIPGMLCAQGQVFRGAQLSFRHRNAAKGRHKASEKQSLGVIFGDSIQEATQRAVGVPMAALIFWDRSSCPLPKVGRCTQGNGADQGWALHKAAAPLGAMVHAEVLPGVVGAGGVAAAVAWPQPRGVGPQETSSSRMPKMSTPAPWPLQLQGCWGPGDTELWLLWQCQALGTGTGTVRWAASGAHRRSTPQDCGMGTPRAELPRVHPSPINRHSHTFSDQTVA